MQPQSHGARQTLTVQTHVLENPGLRRVHSRQPPVPTHLDECPLFAEAEPVHAATAGPSLRPRPDARRSGILGSSCRSSSPPGAW